MIEQTANNKKTSPEFMSNEEFEALPKERKIEYLIELLAEIGIIKIKDPKPEPDPEPVPEIVFDFTELNDEERVLMSGFNTALDEIAAGVYEDWMQTVTKSLNVPRQSRLACIALGYAAGFLHGFTAQTDSGKEKAGEPV